VGQQAALAGVVLPYWLDRPALEALEIARNAEAAGVPELWVGEMLAFDAFALAAAIAAQTTRITLWVGPLAIGVRDPVSLARGIASVSVLGGRGANLALGASTPTVVEQWHGREWRDNVERMRRTVETVRTLLAGERDRGFRLQLGPQSCEVAIAAAGPRMRALADDAADRVVMNLVTPAQITRGPVPVTAWVPAAIDPGEGSWAQVARQLVAYVGARGYGELFAEAGFGDVVALARRGAHPREVAAAVPRELMTAVAAMGDHDTVTSRLAEYAAVGADVAVAPVTADDPGAERLFGTLSKEGWTQ
jgi:probable F420-dependent oxidoreductase